MLAMLTTQVSALFPNIVTAATQQNDSSVSDSCLSSNLQVNPIITNCSFYMQNGTCEQMFYKCSSDAIEMFKNANLGLQADLNKCTTQLNDSLNNISSSGTYKLMTWLAIIIAILLLIDRIFYRFRKKS